MKVTSCVPLCAYNERLDCCDVMQ